MNADKTTRQTSAHGDKSNLTEILDVLTRHWKTIAVTTVIFIALGISYAVTAPSVYRANLLVRIDELADGPTSSKPELLSNLTPSFDTKSNAESEKQLIASRLVIAHVVDTLKLDISAGPARFPVIGGWLARHNVGLSNPGLLGVGGYAWGDESIEVGTLDVPRKLLGRPLKLIALADNHYQLSGDGIEHPVTGMVGKTETFATPVGDITLLVKKMEARPGIRFDVVRMSRQDATDEIQKRLQIVEQGEKSNILNVSMQSNDPVMLSNTLNAIADEYVRENNDRKATIAANSLKFLEGQLPVMQTEMVAAEQRYNAYRNSNTLVDASEEGKLTLQKSAEAEVELLNLRKTRASMADRFAPASPNMVAIDTQIGLIQQYIAKLNARIKAMPQEEQGALGLMRDMRVTTELYSAMRSNIEQLRLVQAGKAGSAQLIDRADVPEHPVRPVRSLIVIVAALLGLCVGVAITLVRHLMLAGVTEPEEVEARTGLMVYAMVPQSAKQRDMDTDETAPDANHLILARRYPRDPTVESLRMFRSALLFAILGARNNIVMLAGPLPLVGKSFVASNLAPILAMAGKRVLLVDGDLRKGRLHRSFGLEMGPGLAEALADPELFDGAIRREVLPNLDILPCGEYPANPSELINGNEFGNLMRKASSQYDIVLLDSAPVLAVSDAGMMAPHAGTVFLVARFSETRVAEIEESIKRFAQTGGRVHGVMLNGFAVSSMKQVHPGRYGSHAYVASSYDGGAR
ncbi:tyrosine-protein kinase Etk/Wzc [Paraburkholderia sp. GAS199]|uniref:polysaccharide biosynthesis tyrosine autokinase n=1 Tax=Paraburkholderia sp. GAS199 TaxID=3035126 RepID=UPI003D1FEA9D